MRVRVYGQVGDGPVMARVVSMRAFQVLWGRFAMAVFHARADHPLVVGDRKVWIELVP